eukprot:4833759-Alexandrium_andersonii.AAC.1
MCPSAPTRRGRHPSSERGLYETKTAHLRPQPEPAYGVQCLIIAREDDGEGHYSAASQMLTYMRSRRGHQRDRWTPTPPLSWSAVSK